MEGSRGFSAAMRELDDKYGDEHVIANAYIKKALDWNPIKGDDSKSLDEFSMFLVECENAANSIEALRVLEYSENIKRLIGKLPYFLHDKWRSIVMQKKERNQIVSFANLVAFVKCESKKANHPVYGKEALRSGQLRKRDTYTSPLVGQFSKTKSSFATSELDQKSLTLDKAETTELPSKTRDYTPKSCSFCETSTHDLVDCRQVMKLSPKERYNFLRKRGLCFSCLKHGHMKTSCKNPATCNSCKGNHPTILHIESKRVEDKTSSIDKTSGFCGQTGAGDYDCAMAIIPVRVRLKDKIKSVETYAFFDSGSSVSFCSTSLLEELGGHGREKRMTLNTMGVPFTMNTCAVNGLQVCDWDEENVVNLPCVYTKDNMPVTQHHIPTDKDIQNWPHLSDIKFPKLNVDIGIMIGNNVPDAFTPCEIRTGEQGSPHATRTRLGWVIWNLIRPNHDASNGMPNTAVVNRAQVIAIEELAQLDQTLRTSINQDFHERMKDEKKENSVEDVKFLVQCEKSVIMIDRHYCVDLPFREPDIQLPNNHSQGQQRLSSLKRKLMKDTKFKRDYVEFMEKIIEKGYAEKIPENEINTDNRHVWYIPHHGIYHSKKPDKIRVVFDCTASLQGVSLNNQLLQGPDLT